MARSRPPSKRLSARGRQILDVIYRAGRATARDVHSAMRDPPTYTGVRGLLRMLVRDGHVRHVRDGVRLVYSPTVPKSVAGRRALRHVARTFFDGSVVEAVAELIGSPTLERDDLERIEELVAGARRRRRQRRR